MCICEELIDAPEGANSKDIQPDGEWRNGQRRALEITSGWGDINNCTKVE